MVIEVYEITNKKNVSYIGVYEVASYKEADNFIDQLNDCSRSVHSMDSRKTVGTFYYEEVNYPKLPTPVMRLSAAGRIDSSDIRVSINLNLDNPKERSVQNTGVFYKFSLKINGPQDLNKKLDELEEFVKEHLDAIADDKFVYSILENLKTQISKFKKGE